MDPYLHLVCNKANHLLGFLHRNLYHCPSYLKVHAYKQIALPSIEYCCTIWYPCIPANIHPQARNDTGVSCKVRIKQIIEEEPQRQCN